MTEVIDKSQLFAKVALVMGQVRTMPKNGENTYDKYSYVTADSAFERLGAAMAAVKLVALPSVIDLRTDEVPAASGKMQTRSIIHGQITLADGDTGATWTNDWWGEGIDRGDKSINKAVTAMMKYHLLRLFMVGTGEDADADSPEIEHKAPQRTQPQQSSNHAAQHRTTPQRPVQPAKGESLKSSTKIKVGNALYVQVCREVGMCALFTDEKRYVRDAAPHHHELVDGIDMVVIGDHEAGAPADLPKEVDDWFWGKPAKANPVPEDVQFMPEDTGIPFGHEDNPFNDPAPAPIVKGDVNPKKLNVLNALGSTFYNKSKSDGAWDAKREELVKPFGLTSSVELNNEQCDKLIRGLEQRIRQVVLESGAFQEGELPVVVQECTAYGDRDGVMSLDEAKGVGLAKVLQEVKRRKVAS